MAKIWQKNTSKANPVVEKYTAGSDYLFDAYILPYDVKASRTHAKMLCSIGILTKQEFSDIEK